jgi:hypothetical protein
MEYFFKNYLSKCLWTFLPFFVYVLKQRFLFVFLVLCTYMYISFILLCLQSSPSLVTKQIYIIWNYSYEQMPNFSNNILFWQFLYLLKLFILFTSYTSNISSLVHTCLKNHSFSPQHCKPHRKLCHRNWPNSK